MKATDFNSRLRAIGLKKGKFADSLGVARDTAYRWKDDPPQYVLAYLEALESVEALRKEMGR